MEMLTDHKSRLSLKRERAAISNSIAKRKNRIKVELNLLRITEDKVRETKFGQILKYDNISAKIFPLTKGVELTVNKFLLPISKHINTKNNIRHFGNLKKAI